MCETDKTWLLFDFWKHFFRRNETWWLTNWDRCFQAGWFHWELPGSLIALVPSLPHRYCLEFLCHPDGGCRFFQTIGISLPNHTVLHPRRL